MNSPPNKTEGKKKKNLRVYMDEVKLRHTSHWDADFMSREEFDAYMRGENVPELKKECDEHAAHPWENDEQTQRHNGEVRGRPLTAWERFLKAILPRRWNSH